MAEGRAMLPCLVSTSQKFGAIPLKNSQKNAEFDRLLALGEGLTLDFLELS